jgi:hypothetical protein
LATAAIKRFAVSGDAENVSVGVVDADWFATLVLCLIAEDPAFDMPEIAMMTIEPAVFEPVATVTVVDVVFECSELRTNTLIVFALLFHCAVPTRVYVPPLLSEHVGAVFVLPEIEAKTSQRWPTVGV